MPCIFISHFIKNVADTPASSIIGSGSSNIPNAPIHSPSDFSQVGMIFLASALTDVAGKYITGIELSYNGWGSSYTVQNQIIKMGDSKTTDPYFPTITSINYSQVIIDGSLIQVKDNFTLSNIGAQSNPGDYIRHDFDTNFLYTGNYNLLISWENRDGDYGARGGSGGWLEGQNFGQNQVVIFNSDDDGGSGYPTGDSTDTIARVPNIIIHYLE
jgi:hypothetical protein